MVYLILLLVTVARATYPIHSNPVYSNPIYSNTKTSNLTQGTLSLTTPSTILPTTPSTITSAATLPTTATFPLPISAPNSIHVSQNYSSSLDGQCDDIYTKNYLSFFQAAPASSSFVYTAHPPCCGTCELFGADVQVFFWPPAGASNASNDASTIVDSVGFTFHSPSIYVGFKSLHATDLCSTGKTVTTTTLSFSVGELSTDIGYRYDKELYLTNPPYIPPTFTKAAWGDQHQSCRNITTSFWQRRQVAEMLTEVEEAQKSTLDHYTVSYNPCSPTIAVPTGLFQAHPFWVSCSPGLAGFYDPPSALRPYTGVMPAPTQIPQSQPTYQSNPALPIKEADPIQSPVAPTPYSTLAPEPIATPTPNKPTEASPLPANNDAHAAMPTYGDTAPNKAAAELPSANENLPAQPTAAGNTASHLPNVPGNDPTTSLGYIATHAPNGPGNQLPSPLIATHLPNGPGNQPLSPASSSPADITNSTRFDDKNKPPTVTPNTPTGDAGIGGMIANLGGFGGSVAKSTPSPVLPYGNTTYSNGTVEFQGTASRLAERRIWPRGLALGCIAAVINLL